MFLPQCCEKLRVRFPRTGKEQGTQRSFFRVLCFRAEAVSGLFTTCVEYYSRPFQPNCFSQEEKVKILVLPWTEIPCQETLQTSFTSLSSRLHYPD